MKNIEITPAIEARAKEIATEMIGRMNCTQELADSVSLKNAKHEAYVASFVGTEKQVYYAVSLISKFNEEGMKRITLLEEKGKTDNDQYRNLISKRDVILSTWNAATIIETLK